MDPDPRITEQNGMFSLMLRSCTAGILAHIVDPSVPFVWIRCHTPKRYLQWWSTQVCLSEAGLPHAVEVRSMSFDLQLRTNRFLELLPEFEDHGIVLFQMNRRIPDTLTLAGIPDEAMNRVLIQNGLHLRFYLPHAIECAQVVSPHREVMAKIFAAAKNPRDQLPSVTTSRSGRGTCRKKSYYCLNARTRTPIRNCPRPPCARGRGLAPRRSPRGRR